jgi:RNA polymerase sigma-70 factor (ECF subfamily)
MALQRPRLVVAGEPASGSPEPTQPLGIEELFRRHAPAVASLGLAMLQNVEEADDLAQDVFIRAWRAIDRLEDPEAARPWLMTIAIRLARTRLRRRKLTRLLFRAEEPEFEPIASAVALPEHRDMIRRLNGVLEQLPAELRIAWVLRHIQEESLQSVADLCGWSLSTAKRRLQAAETRVAAKLNAVPHHARSQP